MRVVVVEDTDDIGDIFAMWLVRAGHEVVLWTDRFEELLAPQPWSGADAAVVDLMLGNGITGATVLAYLAAEQPEVRRILCSALSLDGAEVEDGAHVVLAKPVTEERLLGAVG